MSPNFDQLRKLVLRCGSLLYGHITDITSTEPHYLILLNNNPQDDDAFALVVASSKVERVSYIRKRYGEDTVVEIAAGVESFLSKPTYINCNDVKPLPIAYIRSKYNNKELKCKDATVSKATLSNILQCVRNSRVVPDDIKNLLPQCEMPQDTANK